MWSMERVATGVGVRSGGGLVRAVAGEPAGERRVDCLLLGQGLVREVNTDTTLGRR